MKYNINLAPRRKRSLLERVNFFFSNYLRYILVITQLIVIITLFGRFQIDQNIIDLKESIDQKKEIIKATTSLIDGAKEVNQRSKNIKTLINSQAKFLEMTDYVFTSFPTSVFLSSITIDNESVTMTGEGQDVRQFQSFYNFLKKDGHFKSVQLSDLKKTGSTFSFSMSLDNFISKINK